MSYRPSPDATERHIDIRPNHPLNIAGTKAFLTGHGYAPRVTVRDGRGEVVSTGPVIFFPLDGSYASDGAVRVPDAQPPSSGSKGSSCPPRTSARRAPTRRLPTR